MDSGHWDTSEVGEFDPAKLFGFVYLIESKTTGKAYVGKKQFRFKRQKTKKDKSRTKDSDWKTYCSSCEPLIDDIAEEGEDAFTFKILALCAGKCQLTYEEMREQFIRDVLRTRLPDGSRKYWNATISHMIFSGIEKQTDLTKSLTHYPNRATLSK